MSSYKEIIKSIDERSIRTEEKLDMLLERTIENKIVNKHQWKILSFIFSWLLLISAQVSGWDLSWLLKLKFW